MRIVVLGRSMEVGGAERQMSALAAGLAARGHEVTVLLFYRRGDFLEDLARAGVACESLDKRGRWDLPGFAWRLARRLAALRPDVVQSFLGPPNLVAALLRPLLPSTALVWGVRAATMHLDRYDWTHAAVARMQRFLARLPDLVITNSQAGRRQLLDEGYPGDRLLVIENGVDTARFRPGLAASQALRQRWLDGAAGPLVGLVGRIDPMKDQATFLRAASRFRTSRPEARFVLVGDGDPGLAAELRDLARERGLEDALVWAGAMRDMPAVYGACDLIALTSTGEGFPNVVCEAMACARPVIATSVGDVAALIDAPGRLTPVGDDEAIARAWTALFDLPEADRHAEGARNRARIEAHYSLEAMVQRSEDAYRGLTDR